PHQPRRPDAARRLAARLHQGVAVPGDRGPHGEPPRARGMAWPFDRFVSSEGNGRGLRLAVLCCGAAARRRAGPGEEKVAMRNACLVVVDAQNDFMPGGALAVPGGDEVVPVINRLAARFENVVL